MITLYLLLIIWCIGFVVGSYLLALGFVSWLDNRDVKSYAYDSQAKAWRIFDDVQ